MGEPMVEDAARPHLKTLAGLAKQLNQASDRYTTELKTIEVELQQLNLGIECFLADTQLTVSDWQSRDTERTDQYDDPIPEHYFTYSILGFGKHRGDWRFLVREYERTGDPAASSSWGHSAPVLLEETPLLDMSRDVRIAAAAHIPSLLVKIEQAVEKRLESLNRVTDRKS